MNVISSAQNEKLKRLKKLLADSAYRRENKTWVAEGVRLAEEVLLSGLTVFAAYVSASFEGGRKDEILQELASRKVSVLRVADGVLKQIGDTVSPQGILLEFAEPSHELSDIIKNPRPVVILDRLKDPGNVGTIARSALAAGCAGLVAMGETVDFGNPKVLRSSAGALLRLPFAKLDKVQNPFHMHVYVTTGREGVDYASVDLSSPFAFVVGQEGDGVSREWFDICDLGLTIPMEGNTESLNAAVSASVILFEAARQRRSKPL